MKRLMLSVSLCLFAGVALASPQTEKMKTCNAEAKVKEIKGKEARDKFMSECLKADAPAAKEEKTLTPQQQKMKTCNADAKAKGVKGKEERNKFMSECLKG